MYKRGTPCIGWITRCYTGVSKMGLKRSIKRKTTQPHTKVPNFGFGKTIEKIEKAIRLLDNKK